MMFSGDLDDINRGKVKVIMDKIDEVKRMINVLIKSLKNRHLNPRILDHFLSTNWEKNLQ
jgi:mRNA-degrading endonuclease YafQ of YafQ-DinJ toxin-antitoxin module